MSDEKRIKELEEACELVVRDLVTLAHHTEQILERGFFAGGKAELLYQVKEMCAHVKKTWIRDSDKKEG